MTRPPFGKQLNPGAREIWIYFGSDPWTAAKYRAARNLPVLLLPPDKEPEQYRWHVSGKEVLMIQQGDYNPLKIPSFASLLFCCGASVVRCIYGDECDFISYRRKAYAKAS